METTPPTQISDTQRRLLEFHFRQDGRNGNTGAVPPTADSMIVDLANDLSLVRSIQIRTIIDAIADSSFNKVDKLLSDEVLAKFREQKIFELIADNFIDNLPDRERDADDPDEPAFGCDDAKGELSAFIANYAQDPGKTLDSFIENWCRHLYPHVNFYHLFKRNPQLREKLCEQLEKAAKDIITDKYHILFRRNPRHFILEFLWGRAINIGEKGETAVDAESVRKLVEFLILEKSNPEDIYMILYEELMDMSEIKENILRTRAAVHGNLAGVVSEMDRYPFLHGDFDYDAFFKRHFVPAIRKSRAARLPQKVRLIDSTGVTPEAMTAFFPPAEAIVPLREKADLLESGQDEKMYQIRRYLNYSCTPNAEFSDKEVEGIIAEQLEAAARQITYTISNALKVRGDAEIRNDCQFLPEILGCRDVAKLFVWMARPERFFQEPGHEHHEGRINPMIVSHQARKILELFLSYRKFAFTEEFKSLQKNRKKWEEQFEKLLKLKNKRLVTVRFRVKETLPEKDAVNGNGNGNDNGNNNNGNYSIEYFQEGEIPPHPNEIKVVRESGLLVKYYPVEEKQWLVADGFVPGRKKGTGTPATLWIYSGDGNIIHAKEPESFFSSILRGKVPSDGLRALIAENEALRDWLMEDCSDNVLALDDKKEGRKFSVKGDNRRKSARSRQFSHESPYKMAMYVTSPEKLDDGSVSHSHVKFEVQMDSLDHVLINNLSAYTRLSHETTYTPEREFDSLFRFFFPPILYGTKMADHYRAGYYYNPNREDSYLPPSGR